MKTKLYITLLTCLFCFGKANAQWVVTDPTNLAQSIANSAQEIVETSTTAQNMISNFKETVKIYQQGKKYYDALKSVTNLVKDAAKVRKTILMVGEISDIYIINFQKMMSDKNYTVDELGAIAVGYSKLLAESADMLLELKGVINESDLSMNDKERIDLIDRTYNSVLNYRNLVFYYTNKNIMVSYLRAKNANDTARIKALYGLDNRYW